MADGLWHYDPTTGQTTFEATDGTLTSEDFIGPNNNPVYVAGGNVISALSGAVLNTLGQQGETVFRTFGTGTVESISPISMRTLNNPLASPSAEVRTYVQRQLAGDFTVLDASGNETVLHVDGITTAPLGNQILAYTRDDGTVDIQPKNIAVRSNAELQAIPGFNARWRLATPAEIAEYAIGRYLAHEMPDALRELLRKQGVDESQLNPNDQYELAQLFSIGDISNLQAYSRTWYFAPGNG